MKYNTPSKYIIDLFVLAATDNAKYYSKEFSYNNTHTFYYDRSSFKNGLNGKISFAELVEINN